MQMQELRRDGEHMLARVEASFEERLALDRRRAGLWQQDGMVGNLSHTVLRLEQRLREWAGIDKRDITPCTVNPSVHFEDTGEAEEECVTVWPHGTTAAQPPDRTYMLSLRGAAEDVGMQQGGGGTAATDTVLQTQAFLARHGLRLHRFQAVNGTAVYGESYGAWCSRMWL